MLFNYHTIEVCHCYCIWFLFQLLRNLSTDRSQQLPRHIRGRRHHCGLNKRCILSAQGYEPCWHKPYVMSITPWLKYELYDNVL